MKMSVMRCAMIACLSGAVALPGVAMAQDAAVVAAIGAMSIAVNLSLATIDGSITAMQTDLHQLLTQQGSAINEGAAKVSAAVEANGNADRSLAIRQSLDNRVQDAADRFTVPTSICAESASGGMYSIATSARGGAHQIRSGGGGVPAQNQTVDKAVNGPAVDPSSDQRRVAAVHATYCDKGDFSAYGGTSSCPTVSAMPGADKRLDSVLDGAGPDDKAPELTFSPDQIDAARMYTQNSIYRSVGRTLSKGEAGTPAGAEYIGLRTQYESILDAAAGPQRAAIAERTPVPASKALLLEAFNSPSARTYFSDTASPLAQRLGVMSYAELQQFEVGRRYANPDYQEDLQAMDGDNLVRELIRVASLNAWQLSEVNRKLQIISIIQGASLASSGRDEFTPLLQAKIHEIDQSMGRAR